LGLFDLDRVTWENGVLPALRTNTPTFTQNDWLKPGQGFGGYPMFLESNKPAPLSRVFSWARCDCPTCVREKLYLMYLVVGKEGWYQEIPEGRSFNQESSTRSLAKPKTKEEQESRLLTGIPPQLRKQLTVP
jgi:hypothetical protein